MTGGKVSTRRSGSIRRYLQGSTAFLRTASVRGLARDVLVDARVTPDDLRARTFDFALRVYGLIKPLLRNLETRNIALQLIDAGTSVAANYRAACLGRSGAEFHAKLGIVREESDESLFWLLFIKRARIGSGIELDALVAEAEEIAAIFRAAYRTSENNRAKYRVRKSRKSLNP